MDNSFIRTLQKKRCDYNHPDQATSQANSLILLSSGIYTEEERFVFELLQNAVDAHNNAQGVLDIKMVLDSDYFVFMHNGDEFSERDIEGLCDVGNGNKMKDVKKIGYKGIGFKSVFMRSSHVIVESGGYCFKFDKKYWENYWDAHWDQEKYGAKDDDKKYAMPWQIIPIEAQTPIKIDTDGYNVVTYIQIGEYTDLGDKVSKLLSNSQFLLFLKSKNIRMELVSEGQTKNLIEKSENNGKVILSANGIEESRWLIHMNECVNVPEELRPLICADINTPDKLKETKTFDLSFAIALDENGKFKPLSKEQSVIYTYLPTSYHFGSEGFPFLVNANFITDAGRQQLHKDSEWNKLIFSKIPYEFLSWIREISSSYKNYWEILPKKSYGRGNSLETIYADEMANAIKEIAFIPSLQNANQKVLAADAFMDRMGIADAISVDALVSHINRTYSQSFSISNQVCNIWKGSKVLSSYGVFIFDKQKLKGLFDDEKAFENITVDLSVKLINYLFEYYSQNKIEQEELMSILQSTQFLLDENCCSCQPKELFFPSKYKEQNALADNAKLLHNDIYNAINSNTQIIEWLSILGISYLSDLTFIENEICKSGYVTIENAIEVGKFLYQVYLKEDLFDSISQWKLSYIPFLTTKGNLKSARELFLSSIYKPNLNIETILDEDIFISEKYCENALIAEWKVFLLKMGVKEDISNKTDVISGFYSKEYSNRYDKYFFDIIKQSAERYRWISYEGFNLDSGDYGFYANEISYGSFSFLDYCENYNISKLIFSKIFSNYSPNEIDTEVKSVHGHTGMFIRTVSQSMLTDLDCNINHFKWVIENCQILPTVKQDCRKAEDTYSNSIPQIKEIAGNYLPILDLEEEISESWLLYLGVKNYLTLEDYLCLLTEISIDTDTVTNNKNRISCIYQKIVEFGCLESERLRTQIKDWASSNKILSQEDVFVSPSELSHITLDGFSSKNRVYIGNPSNKEKVIELMSLMGVKIITSESIKTDFESKTESLELKEILRNRVPTLALLASGENADEELYRKNKAKLADLIEHTYFYHCERIKLTYGDSDDIIEKHSFGHENEFYYIGNLRPSNVEPLSNPLCRYLGIRGKEKELFIIFFDTMDGIKQNLADKGYNIDLIEEEQIVESGNIQVTLDYRPSKSAQERNIITGFKGEILVYEKLCSMGYKPECLSISTQEDYTHEIVVDGKTYFCRPNFEKYDITFTTHNGVQVYVEVKATTLSKQYQENMPISYRELTMIEEYNESEEKSYVIIRVFGIDQPKQDMYILKGHLF